MKILFLAAFPFMFSLSLHAQQIDSVKLAKALRFNPAVSGPSAIVLPMRNSNYRYVVNETILSWKEYIAFPKDALPDQGITILRDKASLKKYHAENKLGVVIFHD